MLANGQRISLCLGEEPGDPVFCVSDLCLIWPTSKWIRRPKNVVSGEALNIIVGNLPYSEDKDVKERVKLGILKLLYDTYGIKEEDLVSADLAAVPAGAARDVG